MDQILVDHPFLNVPRRLDSVSKSWLKTWMFEHLGHPKRVIERILIHGINQKKTILLKEGVNIIGKTVGVLEFSPDPKKKATFQEFPSKTIFRTTKTFLGIAGYYRRFLRGLGVDIYSPIHSLTDAKLKFLRSKKHQDEVLIIKKSMTPSPVLGTSAHPWLWKRGLREKNWTHLVPQEGRRKDESHPVRWPNDKGDLENILKMWVKVYFEDFRQYPLWRTICWPEFIESLVSIQRGKFVDLIHVEWEVFYSGNPSVEVHY